VTLDSHVSTGIEVLADIVKNSQFPDFEKERGVVLEEIASVEDVPEEHLHDLFVQRLWPGHPMGTPVTGTYETVASLSIEDVRGYHDLWYRPANMVLAAAGGFDPATLFAQIQDEFAGLSPSTTPPPDSVPEPAAGVEGFDRAIAQGHVCFGFPGPSATHPDRFVYDLLNCALGGGATSRLFDNIREREGLAYSIYSFLSGFRTAGFAGVYAATSPENLTRTTGLAFDELRRFCDEPMSEDELDMNRDQLKGGLLMALERTFSRMMRMGKSMMYHGRVVGIDEVVASLDAVTLDDVQRVAQQTFLADRCVLLTLGPPNAGVGKVTL
jgi:predicted Zn-dependent peptidase